MQTTSSNTAFPAGSSATGPNGSEGTIGKAAASAHGAVDKAASAADEAVRKATPVINRVAESAHQAVNKAVDVAVPTAQWLDEKSGSLKATQEKMLTDARQYVAANPLKAVAAALVAGLLIGRILR